MVKNQGSHDMAIREAQGEVAEYLEAKGVEWTHTDNPYFRVTFLMEEVGELARSVINVEAKVDEPHRRGLSSPHPEKLALVSDSLGDILYHLLGIASGYNIDLQEAFRKSMTNIKTRYPVPTG